MTESRTAYTVKVDDSGEPDYLHRLLVGTATTGILRVEWHMARTGQIIPMNWSKVDMFEFLNSYMPLRYTVDNAQNLIVKAAIESKTEWLLLLEHDIMPPPDAFVRFNEYMNSKRYPVVSGLYYYRSRPSEPLVFRGRGTGVYTDWKMGDKVFCDGVPTGCLLIHNSILKVLWDESEEYQVGNRFTRRIFHSPRDHWVDPETSDTTMLVGTSDLAWCTRLMKDGVFEKAGWPEYQNMRWPFLVDTNIFCIHIDIDGTQYP